MPENQQYKLIPQALPRALWVFLKTLLYFLVLPYKIWKSSTLRLAEMSNNPLLSDKEQLPVYTISKIAYDALIVIMPVIGIIIGLFLLVTGEYGYSSFGPFYFVSSIFYSVGNFFWSLGNFLYLTDIFYFLGQNLGSVLSPFLFCYFMIPFISFIKEILTISLLMVHNLEKIAKNTETSESNLVVHNLKKIVKNTETSESE